MKSLKKTITDIVSITPLEMEFVLSLFKPLTLSKGAYFLQIGNRCNEVAFVESGLLRMFHFNEDGEEATHYFSLPNSFVTSHTSLNNQIQATEGIQAIMQTELLVISKPNLEIMYQKVP